MPDDLDLPIWGAQQIAFAAGLLKPDGSPDERRVFYLLETKAIDGTKVGHAKRGRWVSTLRRIRRSLGIVLAERADASPPEKLDLKATPTKSASPGARASRVRNRTSASPTARPAGHSSPPEDSGIAASSREVA